MFIDAENKDHINIYFYIPDNKTFFERIKFCLSYIMGDYPHFVSHTLSRRETTDLITTLETWLDETASEVADEL